MNERVAVIGAGGATGQRIARARQPRRAGDPFAGSAGRSALASNSSPTADLTSPASLVADAGLVVNTAAVHAGSPPI